MEWYYADGNEKRGPIADAEFQTLVQQGIISADTLIWREGMAGWERHGGNTPPLPISNQTTGSSVVCFSCGRTVPERDSLILTGKPCCLSCKPQVLARINEGKPIVSDGAVETRNRYLKHEASVKSIGLLYYLGGGAMLVGGIAAAAAVMNKTDVVESLVVGGMLLVLGAGQIVCGYGLRRLEPWTRVPVGILSGIGLIGFPIGTLINAYVLYLVFSQKGTFVFSPEYRAVIAETPHIKYRTSIVIWILLGLVVLLVVLGVTAAFFSKP